MTVNTITVGAGTLSIGATTALTQFESQIRAVKIVPKVKQDDPIWVLSGESVGGAREETFTMEGTMLQDLGHTGSKLEWLWAHAGEEHPFELVYEKSRNKKITGKLIVEAIEIGGEAKTKPESDFEFTILGRPEIVTTGTTTQGITTDTGSGTTTTV